MRSLNYIAAALLPVINFASAGSYGNDGTVIVTETRTITVCPVIDWMTCDDNQYTSSIPDRDSAPPTTTRITTTPTTTPTSISISITTSGGPPTSSGEPIISTITTGFNRTITTITPDPIDGGITTNPDNRTTSITTSSGITTSSSSTTSITTSGCFNATRTAAPFPFNNGFINNCNRPGARDQWCDGKTVNSDTEPVYRTGQVRRYKLDIGTGFVDPDGNGQIPVFTINGKTPGDPIIANWGDDVEIVVTNVMDSANGPQNATTIHWHGILQHGTNDQDGVPGVTECGIAPGESRTYRWHASTYGTAWYHGHLLSQYGGGVRGPIIIHGPASADYDLDMGTIMIDEKFNQGIFNIAKFYATVRGTTVANNYLLNGKNANANNPNLGEAARWIVKSGKKHLFRIINSSAQSGFVFHIDNHKMTVVSADMVPIQPYVTEELWIHSGQRYNVIVTADQPIAAYDVRGIVQQGCGTNISNTGLLQSNGIMEYEGSCYSSPARSNYTLDTKGICKDELLSTLKPVFTKDAGDSGEFAKNVVNMAGGTNEFVNQKINRWYFGGATPFTGTANSTAFKRVNVTYDLPTLQLLDTVGTNDTSIYGNSVFYNAKDQWIYWIIQNLMITSHPMHLHGHDFAVLGQDYGKVFTQDMVKDLNFKNPMRRDTVLLYGAGTPRDLPSDQKPGYTVIGFKTDNPGTWLMHCHIIWHADLGMGIQIVERPDEISSYSTKPEFQNECASMKAYEAGDPANRMKAEYESGLKKRHLEEHKFHGYSHNHAVRHA